MLPRSSTNVEVGAERRASWARRRTEPVATVARRREPGESAPDQRVAAIAPLGDRGDDKPSERHRRQVLGGVHRHVGAPVEHRGLHLLDEHALATDRVQIGTSWCDRPSVSTRTSSTSIDGRPRAAAHRCVRLASARGRSLAWRCAPRTARPMRQQIEQVAERFGVALARWRAGVAPSAHGRLVQQLGDDALGDAPRPPRAAPARASARRARGRVRARPRGRPRPARAARRRAARPRVRSSVDRDSARPRRRRCPAPRRSRCDALAMPRSANAAQVVEVEQCHAGDRRARRDRRRGARRCRRSSSGRFGLAAIDRRDDRRARPGSNEHQSR